MVISLRHKSDHVIFRLTIDSHLVHAPCCLIPTIFSILFSSSLLRISLCSNLCLSLPNALSILTVGKKPKPARPVATAPKISFSRSRSSAILTSFAAFHFFPVYTSTPAPVTLGSLENINCIDVLIFAT